MEIPVNPDDITQFDFIVCGSGSNAAFLARCLAYTEDMHCCYSTSTHLKYRGSQLP
jgi:hypothetical protein